MLFGFRVLLWLALAFVFSPASAQTPPPRSKPFVMAVDVDGFGYRYSKRVFTEAFKRLGIPMEMEIYPLARRAALVAEGFIDGEASRVYSYADTHPELVRVEESIIDFRFSVFTANPALRAKSPEDLPPNALVEYRRGIMLCENALKKAIPPERLSTVVGTDQGIKKLLAGRSDAYCDIDTFFNEALHSGEIKDPGKARKLFEIASLPTYPYLYKKHAELAPKLAAVLKKMKEEGLLDRYRTEAEQDGKAQH
jgi:polar amino acid transport system substrate-binding protein